MIGLVNWSGYGIYSRLCFDLDYHYMGTESCVTVGRRLRDRGF